MKRWLRRLLVFIDLLDLLDPAGAISAGVGLVGAAIVMIVRRERLRDSRGDRPAA